MALLECPLEDWTFDVKRAKNEDSPPETLKLKVIEVSQSGF